jgi:hypothetical protein
MSHCIGRLVRAWFFREAAFWQFWRPQSGLPGGVICGVVFCGVVIMTALFGVLSL